MPSWVRPHITLLACDSVDVVEASTLLDRFAALTLSFPVCMALFGFFPGPPPAAFLAPKITSDLFGLTYPALR
jgi:hypothetical protein